MMIVTNIAAVNEAFFAKTPRPIREVMREIYPDATEDANGRFHAPHDGYICPITDKEFRGGEYLPADEPEDMLSISGRTTVYPNAFDLQGNRHEWNGTRAQNIAAWGVIIEQNKAHDAERSHHVGTVGEYSTLELTIQHIAVVNGYYGDINIHITKDPEGNVVIYKGSNKVLAKKGCTVKVKAKIKSHGEREGVKQTVIERPKVLP